MNLPLRVERTRAHKLKPLRYNTKQIYEQGRVHTPLDWWRYYWGTEPYSRFRTDRSRCYGTIFVNKQSY